MPLAACLSEGCTASLETERVMKCSVDGCNEIFCVSCFEQLEAEIGKEDHEFCYLCEGQDGSCGVEAVWECQEETIAFCDECFKSEHKGRRKSHSKIALQRKRLKCEEKGNLNVFDAACYGEMRHELVLADEEKKWMQISADNWNRFKQDARDEYSPAVSFIGSTGTGKSFLVSSFVGDDKSSPTVAPINQKGSTSANINLFHAPGYDTDEFSFRRLLLLDCEGDGGTVPEMLRQRWIPLQSKLSKKLNLSLSQNRTHVIREEFPRFAYLTSDVIVFLETVDFTRIQDYLAKFQKFIDATQKGVLSATTPSLLIIQNKVDPIAVNNRLSVSEATEDFFNLAFPFCKHGGTIRRSSDSLGRFEQDEEDEEDETETESETLTEDSPIIPQTPPNPRERKKKSKSKSRRSRSSKSKSKRSKRSKDDFETSKGSSDSSSSAEKSKTRKRRATASSKEITDATKKSKSKSKSSLRSTTGTIKKHHSNKHTKEETKKEKSDPEPTPDPLIAIIEEKKQVTATKSLNEASSSSPEQLRDNHKSSSPITIHRGSSDYGKGSKTPPFRTLLSPKTVRGSPEESVPARARTMLQGVEKGVTTMLPSAMAERVEKVSRDVKGSVGGVADRVGQMGGKVRQMGGNMLDADILKHRMRSPDQNLTEEERIKDDKRKRREFLNSFEIIRCVRIPNYRYVGSIEPYLKAFRDEVKKMVNHHASKKLKNGTNYSESIWLDIAKELIQSCTSFSDSQVGIRMAQIVGKVMQPASGEELSASIYNFFNILLNEVANKENFLKVRASTENYLTLILANTLRKTGTKIESRDLINDPKHPFSGLCAHMFTTCEKAIDGLVPCEFRSRKETCTQLQKDHDGLHRFPSGKKKSGDLVFSDPEGESREEREKRFTEQVYEKLKVFHKDVTQSIVQRIEILSSIEKPEIMKSKAISSEFLRCLLCFSNAHDTLLSCRHSFCKHCMKEAVEAGMQSLQCPLCLNPMAMMIDNYKIPGRAGYRVLSLDGGGIKGIIELCILSRICSRLPGCNPYQLFDLVVGTSTGAIVGAAIAICKKSVDEALTLYKQFPAKVFKKRMVTNVNVLKVAYLLMGGKHLYRISVLENILATLIDMDCDFIETLNDPTTPKVALVATNYSSNPMHPTLFCNYTRDSGASQYEDIEYVSTCKIHQGLTASAAAPIFFAPYRIDNVLYVDGALSANNPTELALNEGLRLWPDREVELVLSLGTGVPPTEAVSDSLFSWAGALTAKATDPNVVHNREALKFNRLRESASDMNGSSLADRIYFRFNPLDVSVDLDSTNAKALDQLVHLTDDYLDEPEVQPDLDLLIHTIVAKGYYISQEVDFTAVGAEQVRVSFTVQLRIPLETAQETFKGFLFNHVPQGNFASIGKTYHEYEDGIHRISFVAAPGSSYLTSVQLIIAPNEPAIHISGSPFALNITPGQGTVNLSSSNISV